MTKCVKSSWEDTGLWCVATCLLFRDFAAAFLLQIADECTHSVWMFASFL